MLTCCNATRTAFVTVVLSDDDIVATAASMWAILDETVLMSVLMVVIFSFISENLLWCSLLTCCSSLIALVCVCCMFCICCVSVWMLSIVPK